MDPLILNICFSIIYQLECEIFINYQINLPFKIFFFFWGAKNLVLPLKSYFMSTKYQSWQYHFSSSILSKVLRVIFSIYWLILRKNAFYLYLDRSKLSLMYQQICEVYFTSDIIKDMKIDPRNKWTKVVSLKLDTRLDTSIYRGLMKKLDTSSTYWTNEFQNITSNVLF